MQGNTTFPQLSHSFLQLKIGENVITTRSDFEFYLQHFNYFRMQLHLQKTTPNLPKTFTP